MSFNSLCLGLGFLVGLALSGCEYRKTIGDPVVTEGGSLSCVDAGVSSSCEDVCGGCTNPPSTGTCWPSFDPYVAFVAERPVNPGVCNPLSLTCEYPTEEQECPEDCTAGICHMGGLCQLDFSDCDIKLGCKWHSASELRCKAADDQGEGELCDESVKGLRCASGLVCVKPAFVSDPVCAYLCQTDGHCFGNGLQNRSTCVIDGTLGQFGWCR